MGHRSNLETLGKDPLRVLRFRNRVGVFTALCAAVAYASPAAPAALEVMVLDRDGRPVSGVVVTATSRRTAEPAIAAASSRHAIMDQVQRQFVPRILVIQAGTAVEFPNSDSIAHQVYSFSPAKRFQLSLYRGHVYPPLVFDKPGLVVLGCNIHDNMLGYIYVTASPYFGKTGTDGRLQLEDLPDGEYQVTLWSPRFNEVQEEISRSVQLATAAQVTLDVRLTQALSPEPRSAPPKAGSNEY